MYVYVCMCVSCTAQYTVFGQVIDGLEVLEAMEKVPVGKKNRPLADIKIETIVIHANPLAT